MTMGNKCDKIILPRKGAYFFAQFFTQMSLPQLRVLRVKRGRLSSFKRMNNKIGGAERMAAGARVKITLRCDECKQRNYNTVKNKKNDPDRLEMNKYCPFCRKHTVHSETK